MATARDRSTIQAAKSSSPINAIREIDWQDFAESVLFKTESTEIRVDVGGTDALVVAAGIAVGTQSHLGGAGSFCTAIGAQTLGFAGPNTGGSNVAVGGAALYSNQGGDNNVAVGNLALWQQTSGRYNIAMGVSAGGGTVSGQRNVFLGKDAGYFVGMGSVENATGQRQVMVGYDARPEADGEVDCISIGYAARGRGAGTAVIGGAAITEVFLKGSMVLEEQGSAPTGATDEAYLFIEDNGSGKTRLMVQFQTGPAQQIAIEP